MISSLLSAANNAALYSCHKPVARAGLQTGGFSYLEEREASEAQNRPQGEVRQAARQDRFAESLAARLKETGLTGPGASERIAEVSAQAQEIVSRIRREEGGAEANRAKARILTLATAENADAVLGSVASSAAAPSPGADGTAAPGAPSGDPEGSLPAPSADEIARRAAARLAEEEAAPPTEAPPEGGGSNAASAVRGALDEIEAFAPGVSRADSAGQFFKLVNKAAAQPSAQAAGYGAAAYGGAYGGSTAPAAYQASYAARTPWPGSLLSVTV
jgi:hypothetical protein